MVTSCESNFSYSLIGLGLERGVTYTSREKLVDFGPVQAIAEIYKILPLSPLMGGLVLVGGIVLVVVGVKNSSAKCVPLSDSHSG